MIRFLAICLLPVLVTSCSFSMPSKMGLPKEVTVKKTPVIAPRDGIMVWVDEFADKRPNNVILSFRSETIEDGTPTGGIASNALTSALTKAGFVSDANAPLVITGSVKRWAARALGGSPGRIDAFTTLHITLLDPSNSPIYSGDYRGFSHMKGSGLGKPEVVATLRRSMIEAVNQVLKDKKLINLLESF